MPEDQPLHQIPEPAAPRGPDAPMLFITPEGEGPEMVNLPNLRLEYPLDRLDEPGHGSFAFKPEAFEMWRTSTPGSTRSFPSIV